MNAIRQNLNSIYCTLDSAATENHGYFYSSVASLFGPKVTSGVHIRWYEFRVSSAFTVNVLCIHWHTPKQPEGSRAAPCPQDINLLIKNEVHDIR